MEKMLVEYVRKGGKKRYAHIYKDGELVRKKTAKDKGGVKVGVLVAMVVDENTVCIGWSRCHKDDAFDKREGLDRAIQRASLNDAGAIAHSMAKKTKGFIARVGKIYKDKKIEVPFTFPYDEAQKNEINNMYQEANDIGC